MRLGFWLGLCILLSAAIPYPAGAEEKSPGTASDHYRFDNLVAASVTLDLPETTTFTFNHTYAFRGLEWDSGHALFIVDERGFGDGLALWVSQSTMGDVSVTGRGLQASIDAQQSAAPAFGLALSTGIHDTACLVTEGISGSPLQWSCPKWRLLTEPVEYGSEWTIWLPAGTWTLMAVQGASERVEWVDFELGVPEDVPVRWTFTTNTAFLTARDFHETGSHGSARVLAHGAGASQGSSASWSTLGTLYGLAGYVLPLTGVDNHEFWIDSPSGTAPGDDRWFFGEGPGTYRARLDQQLTAGDWPGRTYVLYADFPR